MGDELKRKALEAFRIGVMADEANEPKNALKHFKMGLGILGPIALIQKKPEDIELVTMYLNRTEELQEQLYPKRLITIPKPRIDRKPDQRGAISPSRVGVRSVDWDQIVGLKDAKQALQEAGCFPRMYPQFFQSGLNPWKGILLYGPPGTGKSMLSEALATACGSSFRSIKGSDIFAKYFGESEKKLHAVFTEARENAPSVIFLDEVDYLCGDRNDEAGGSVMTRIKSQLLAEMDLISKSKIDVLVLGATNLPFNIDSAFRRRFERSVYIPLPNAEDRKLLFNKLLFGINHVLSEEQLDELAERTNLYSCDNIRALFKEVGFRPIREAVISTHFKQNEKGMYIACEATDNGAIAMKLSEVPSDKLVASPIRFEHFESALKVVKTTIKQTEIDRLEAWSKTN